LQPKLWSPLSDEYKPPTLLYRNVQLEKMLNYATHPLPSNMFGQGDKGLGKTLTARIFSDEVEARGIGKCYYVKWQRKLTSTLKDLNDNYTLKIRGYTLSTAEICHAIINQTDKNDLCCLIIDEPQNAYSWKDVDRAIFDFYEHFLGQRKFCLIMLSQVRFLTLSQYFAPDTMSRLRLKPILFPSYDAPEIVEIVKQRLQYMLEPNQYDEQALPILAKHVRRIGGDIREALDILEIAVKEANNKLIMEDMISAIEQGKDRWWKTELASLPPHWAFLLYLSALETFERNETMTTQPRVMHQYNRTAKEKGFDPLGRRMVYYAFNKLAEKGYFSQELKGKGRQRITELTLDESDRNHIIRAGKEIEWEFALSQVQT